MNKVCPSCGSSHIVGGDEVILGAGTVHKDARCLNCKWAGKDSDLLSIPEPVVAKHVDGGLTADRATEIAKHMTQDLLARLAHHAGKSIGLSLVEAGFVGMNDSPRLGRLIRAACLGAVAKVLDEIEELQKEARDGQANHPA